MAASVQIDETNGAGAGSETANVSNLNYGNNDSANLTPATYPITAGNNSFHKMNRFRWASGTANKINNLQVFKSAGAYVTGEGIQCNLRTSSYGGALSYAANNPATTTYTDQALATSDPGAANLGIAGSLSGELVAAGYSDYMKHQLQTTGSTPAGNVNQKTIDFQYDEQ